MSTITLSSRLELLTELPLLSSEKSFFVSRPFKLLGRVTLYLGAFCLRSLEIILSIALATFTYLSSHIAPGKVGAKLYAFSLICGNYACSSARELLFFSSLEDPLTFSDGGHLYKAHIDQYLCPSSSQALQEAIQKASAEGKKISFAGQRYSQGGHTFSEGGVVIDMRSLNKILKIDPAKKTISVQAGATWEEIQNALNPYNLAVKVAQASNIFTVGGSLSVNVHGRDPRYGTLIETIRSIKIVTADGTLIEASRKKNKDLFEAAIGGYGLFGAILEAEIEVTDNEIYQRNAEVMSIETYISHFKSKILHNLEVGLHFARINLTGKNSFKEILAVSYKIDPQASCPTDLQPEGYVSLHKILLFFFRHFGFMQSLRWPLEVSSETKPCVLTRNQAMRPPVKCLEYDSRSYTDILQEYFIPLDQFLPFTQALEEIVKKEGINLLNVTIRYVPQDKTSLLRYAKKDCFAFVLYITEGLSKREQEKAKKWTQELIDKAVDCGGTYYLPYQLYASKDQLKKAYPEVDRLLAVKKRHDPVNRFSHLFFQTYFR